MNQFGLSIILLIIQIIAISASIPGKINSGSFNSASPQSFFSNTRPGGGAGALFQLSGNPSNNILTNPSGIDRKITFDPISPNPTPTMTFQPQPILEQSFKPVTKPYDANAELQKSLKQQADREKLFETNSLKKFPPPVQVVPLIPNPIESVESEKLKGAIKGAFEGAKYVVFNPSNVEKPVKLLNKDVAKAFKVGEVLGGAIAGAYYGSEGIDVGEKLKEGK